MDPNSAHQHWSEWTFTIDSSGPRHPSIKEVELNFARFFAGMFGATAQMRVKAKLRRTAGVHSVRWIITVQADTEPLHDALWRAQVEARVKVAVREGFGDGAILSSEARLLAGETADGSPRAQWLILPPLQLLPTLWGIPSQGATQTLGLPSISSTAVAWR